MRTAKSFFQIGIAIVFIIIVFTFLNKNFKEISYKKVSFLNCDNVETPRYFAGQRAGSYLVLYNYIQRTKSFGFDESITYTTHAEWTFLVDNLVSLLERWQGPVSLTVYSPGTDFNETLTRILYLRECRQFVKDFVTFHLFFDNNHLPQIVPPNPEELLFNCTLDNFNFTSDENSLTYRKEKELLYPINVGRNVAREMATTRFVLPSDIELYPSPNLIPDFLEMIKHERNKEQKKVFVLSIFEVEGDVTRLPGNKQELVQMLKNNSAIPFHKYVCPDCHRVPEAEQWVNGESSGGLNVFHVGKRLKPFQAWEPIYIGTNAEPFYDERLSVEGLRDKMTQGYVLCLMDYEFHILDNAFLVHRPGIKKRRVLYKSAMANQSKIMKTVLPELKLLYGSRDGCVF